MKKLKLNFKSILSRLLYFNIILVIIVVGLSQVIFYYYAMDNYKKERINMNFTNATRVRDCVDEAVFRQVLNLSSSYFNDLSSNNLLMLPTKEDIRDYSYTIKQISGITYGIPLTYDFVSKVSIYYPKNNLLFRGHNAFFLDDYGEYSRYPEWMLNIITSEERNGWKKVEDEESACIYFRSFPYNSQATDVVFVVEVDQYMLIKEIEKIKSGREDYFGLFDEQGELVVDIHGDSGELYLEEGLRYRINELQGDGFFEYSMDGKKYMIACAVSEYNDWKYVLIVSEENIFAHAADLAWKVFGVSILYTLISLAAAVFVTKKANSPMEVVLKNMEKCIENEKAGDDVNQYEVIGNTFHSLTVQVKELEKQLSANQPVIYKNIIDRILNNDGQQLYRDAKMIHFEKSLFCCFIIQMYYREELNIYSRVLLNYNLIDFLNSWNRPYGIYSVTDEKDVIYGIVNFSEKDELSQVAGEVYRKIENYISEPFILCLGRIAEEECKIHLSYKDVLKVKKHAFFCRDKKLLYYDDLDWNTLQATGDLEKHIEKISRELRSGKTDIVKDLLALINEAVSSNLYTDEYCMNTLTDTVYTIRKAMLVLGKDEFSLFGGDIRQQLKEIRHIREYETWITDLLESIELSFSRAKEDDADELRTEIMEYVESNIFQDITLSKMSNDLGISFSHLSRVFKALMGMTYTEYLFQTKMKKAEELLTTTNLPVKEISAKLGYSSITHFIKIFKEHFGMTPKQMRTSRL